jgi:putative tricarboxylic transport membrane protein
VSPEPGPGWQPDHEIELFAGTPAGGGQDRVARALAAGLAGVLDVPIRVTNVPGRGGGNAWDELTDRAGDPHRLAISSPTLVTNPLVGVSDLEPDVLAHLAVLCNEYIAFAVPVDSWIPDAAGLIEIMTEPRDLVVAFATERGNVNHMALAELCRHQGSDPRQLSIRVFESARHAVADVLESESDLVAVTAASVVPELAEGLVEVLAVSSPARLAAPFESVPTWAELGVECTIGTWRGVIGPPDLSEEQITFWNGAVEAALATGSWRDARTRHVWSDTHVSGAAAREFVVEESARMEFALRAVGLIA